MFSLEFIFRNTHGKHLLELLWLYFQKRSLDLVVAIVGLVLLLPVFIILSILIKATSTGPVLFIQGRVGFDAIPFKFYKFRSMYVHSEKQRVELQKQNQHGESGITFKMKNDPRITPIGKFIRKYSIDELPQLWNVLRGDMSLVGPRPPIVSEVSNYSNAEKMRLLCKPGITGIWQVSGRSEVPFEEQYQMDILYMANYSLMLDLRILWKTIFIVVSGKGAY